MQPRTTITLTKPMKLMLAQIDLQMRFRPDDKKTDVRFAYTYVKADAFSIRKKKRTKNGYCVKPPLV